MFFSKSLGVYSTVLIAKLKFGIVENKDIN